MTYHEILQTFKDACPAVTSVVFCDGEGETIDFVTDVDSYHTQLLGAYQSDIVLRLKQIETQSGVLGRVELRTETATIALWPVATGYYVVALLRRGGVLPAPAVLAVTRTLEENL